MNEQQLKKILDAALSKQRKEIFSALGAAVGYDLGDPDDVKGLRKDLHMLRNTRLRSERFTATGERIFYMFFWGTILTGITGGAVLLFKEKIKAIIGG